MNKFLDANGLKQFLKGTKTIFAKKQSLKDLNSLFQVVEINENLMAVCDRESNILCFIDANGVVQHTIGTKTAKLNVTGDAKINGSAYIGDCKLVEGDDPGMLYIVDNENHILLWIKSDGTVDFNGIPTDIQTEFDSIKQRLIALETKTDNAA